MRDDRLRLIFTCCHPALAPARAGRADPAAARRADDAGDRARLPRAGADDGAADRAGQGQDPRRRASPTACPREADLPERPARRCWPSSTWSSTRATRPARASALVREDLCAEAIRLGRLLAELMPDEPEVLGLLALMLLDRVAPGGAHDGRRRARAARRPGPRAAGTAALIAEGQALVRALPAPRPARARTSCRRRSTPCTPTRRPRRTPTGRRSSRSTTSCSRVAPTPVVALNRAVAVAEVDGPAAGAGARRRARPRAATTCSTPSAPTCCARLGRDAEAADAYDAALARRRQRGRARLPAPRARRPRRLVGAEQRDELGRLAHEPGRAGLAQLPLAADPPQHADARQLVGARARARRTCGRRP